MADVTNPIIETIARAYRDADASGIGLGDVLPAYYINRARLAITALEEKGWAVVPVEPTEAMVEAGMDYDERHLELKLGRPPTVEECQADEYLAMIQAGKAKG